MGLEDVGVRLVVEDEAKFVAAMKAADTSTSGLGKTTEKLPAQMTPATKSSFDFSKAITGVNMAMEVGQKAAKLIGDAYDATVGKFVSYGEEVRQVTLLTGQSAESASKLVRVADDLGVSTDSLQIATKFLAKEGLTPSVETMANLSDQFLAIQDPAERDTFLIKQFGKSGLDMASMMSQGGDTIRAMGDEVQSNLILTQADIDAAHKATMAQRELKDNTEALGIAFGKVLTPFLNSATDALITMMSWEDKANKLLEEHDAHMVIVAKDYHEYSLEAIRSNLAAKGFIMTTDQVIAQLKAEGHTAEEEMTILGLHTQAWWELSHASAQYADDFHLESLRLAGDYRAFGSEAITTIDDIKGAMSMFATEKALKKTIDDAQGSVVSLTAQIQVLSKLKVMTPQQGEEVNVFWQALELAKKAADGSTFSVDDLQKTIKRLMDVSYFTPAQKKDIVILQDQIGKLAGMTKTEAAAAVKDLQEKIYALADGTYLTDDQKAQLLTLTGQLEAAKQKVEDATKAYQDQEHQMIWNAELQSALAMSGGKLTDTMITNLGNQAISWGMLDQATLTAWKDMNDANTNGVLKTLGDVRGAVDWIKGGLDSISGLSHDQTFNFHVNYTTSGGAFGGGGLAPTAEQVAQQQEAAAQADNAKGVSPGADYYWDGTKWVKRTGAIPNAAGGSWVIPPGYENERYRFPDGRTASSGEIVTVVPAPKVYAPVSGSSVANYNYANQTSYNLSVMTSQAPGLIQHSFAMMKLLAG